MQTVIDSIAAGFRDDMAVFVPAGEIIPRGYGLWYHEFQRFDGGRNGGWYLPIPINWIASVLSWAHFQLCRCGPARQMLRLRHDLIEENDRLRDENDHLKRTIKLIDVTRRVNKWV